MSKAVETLPPEIQSPGSVMTPMSAIEQAVASGATPETLEKLLALQERFEAGQARKAFSRAMAAAKAEIPPIEKTKTVRYETNKANEFVEYKHETLAHIAQIVDPILAKHGLSYRYRTSSEVNQPVSVTCIVSHADGHSEENTLHAGRDSSGKKNDIQQIGSTITYLQRYTLKAALGLSAYIDNDGQTLPDDADPNAWVTADQAEALRRMAEEAGCDIPKLCQYLNVSSIPDLAARDYQRAVQAINAKKAQAGRRQ